MFIRGVRGLFAHHKTIDLLPHLHKLHSIAVFGRGTLYMKWGLGNLRFATMRLRGEKDENEENQENDKNEKMRKCENIIFLIKCYFISIEKYNVFMIK